VEKLGRMLDADVADGFLDDLAVKTEGLLGMTWRSHPERRRNGRL